MFKQIALATALVAITSGSVFAQGVKVNDKVTQYTFHNGTHLDIAAGAGAEARSSIGSIQDTEVNAEIYQETGVFGDTGAFALGDNAEANLAVGSIYDTKVDAEVDQYTYVNNAFSAAGTDAKTCTGIGVIGKVPGC
ncbi:MAG: hypothetical protein ACFB6S_06235 [Geminicoccaceae bacterium]